MVPGSCAPNIQRTPPSLKRAHVFTNLALLRDRKRWHLIRYIGRQVKLKRSSTARRLVLVQLNAGIA